MSTLWIWTHWTQGFFLPSFPLIYTHIGLVIDNTVFIGGVFLAFLLHLFFILSTQKTNDWCYNTMAPHLTFQPIHAQLQNQRHHLNEVFIVSSISLNDATSTKVMLAVMRNNSSMEYGLNGNGCTWMDGVINRQGRYFVQMLLRVRITWFMLDHKEVYSLCRDLCFSGSWNPVMVRSVE